MRKPTSILETKLTEPQQAQLAEWLLSGIQYERARVMVQEEFGVTAAIAQYSRFWQSVCAPLLIARRHRAAQTSDAIAAEAAARPGQFDQATIDAIKQKSFELAINPSADPNDVRSLFGLILKVRDQDMSREQLALDRERFEFDAVKRCLAHLPDLRAIAADPALDDQARLTAARQRLFGTTPQ